MSNNEITKSEITNEQEATSNKIEYKYPPMSLLSEERFYRKDESKAPEITGEQFIDALNSLGIKAEIVSVGHGPAVSRFEFKPIGTRISEILDLEEQIASKLDARSIRIVAPVPNKAAIAIEIPNKNRQDVNIQEILDSQAFKSIDSKLAVALGRDVYNEPCAIDIAKMPHMLIAGGVGMGSPDFANSFIMSILYNASPDEVKMMLIDPYMLDFIIYNGIPHLLVHPIIFREKTENGVAAFGWALSEMERRCNIIAENGVLNIDEYNNLAKKNNKLKKLPKIVIFVSNISYYMEYARQYVENCICNIAQKGHNVGIHLILLSCRYSRNNEDFFTNIIRANIPSHIAFRVHSENCSRMFIGKSGAEKLTGMGDMLFWSEDTAEPKRIQGCLMGSDRIEKVVDYIKTHYDSEYDEQPQSFGDNASSALSKAGHIALAICKVIGKIFVTIGTVLLYIIIHLRYFCINLYRLIKRKHNMKKRRKLEEERRRQQSERRRMEREAERARQLRNASRGENELVKVHSRGEGRPTNRTAYPQQRVAYPRSQSQNRRQHR